MAAMQKTFDCLTCSTPIKLERDQVNNKWKRYELDGVTEHKCQRKKIQPQQQQPAIITPKESPNATLDDIAEEIYELKATIKVLISQVEKMRQELQNKNASN